MASENSLESPFPDLVLNLGDLSTLILPVPRGKQTPGMWELSCSPDSPESLSIKHNSGLLTCSDEGKNGLGKERQWRQTRRPLFPSLSGLSNFSKPQPSSVNGNNNRTKIPRIV